MSRAPQPAGPDARLLQGQVATLSLLAQLTRRARHAAALGHTLFTEIRADLAMVHVLVLAAFVRACFADVGANAADLADES